MKDYGKNGKKESSSWIKCMTKDGHHSLGCVACLSFAAFVPSIEYQYQDFAARETLAPRFGNLSVHLRLRYTIQW
jgi:hypothetical protein